MVCECSNCYRLYIRGWANDWNDPCENCGCEIFIIHHFGYKNVPSHTFRKNVVTGELLESDLCDSVIA